MVSHIANQLKNELNRIGGYYRLKFEEKKDYGVLVEFALRPSAWQMSWFKSKVLEHLVVFIRWCRDRRLPYSKITGWLNAKGPKPFRGNAWQRSSVRYLANRTPSPDLTPKIQTILAFLKALRWAWENRQPGQDKATLLANTPEERVRRVREFYEFLLPMARGYVAYLGECFHQHERVADRFQRRGSGMARRREFAFRYYSTPSFKARGFIEVCSNRDTRLKQGITAELFGEEDIYPTRQEIELLGRHKVKQATLQIACRLEGLSVKTFRRYRAQIVQ
ncbi:MAG TPA: hypothetical protein VEJ45_05550 [Candidatus Acidoferrales bacterium]|nr:hypothetical protein [Candidatus Acidoferrales bacterium]